MLLGAQWSLVAAVPPLGALSIVDMFTANDEIDMLRYRLRLHQPLALRTIILESNMTHSGVPKPLHVRNALTPDEIERFNVHLIQVPFSRDLVKRASCKSSAAGKCAWVLEMAQRRFVNRMMQEQIDELNRTRGLDNLLFHMSDLDELLDLQIVADAAQKGQIARSGWFGDMVAAKTIEGFQLRRLAGRGCTVLQRWSGWHFGYFMSSAKILKKYRAFAHAHDKYVFKIINASNPLEHIDRKAKNCLDIHGRKYGPTWTGFDGRLPPLPGWPRNPVAPSAANFSAKSLAKERAVYEKEALRSGNVTRLMTAAEAARLKLAAIDAQLELIGESASDDAGTTGGGLQL